MHNQKKEDMLTIGELAKLTGAGIRALHYYERKGILKPAYVDPETGYRYYAYDQADFADIIKTCVELGIPLKELTYLSQNEDTFRLNEFFARLKDTAEQKVKLARVMGTLAEKALQKIEDNRPYNAGQIYTRQMPGKVYYTKSCGKSLRTINCTKFMYDFINDARPKLDITGKDEQVVLMEYGFLCDCSPGSQQYCAFLEIPEVLSEDNIITIAPGVYPFYQDKQSKIEDAPQIFEEHLTDSEHHMFIEVEELMTGKTKIHEPIHELRLVSFL